MSKKSIVSVIIVIVVVIGVWWYVSSANHLAVPSASIQSASSTSQSATNSLVGTWVSATSGKGMEASGKLILKNSITQLNMSGDVSLIIDSMQGGVASGTLSYINICTSAVTTVTGKSPVTRSPECITENNKSVELQISGNIISFEGPTDTGGKVTFNGTYSNNSLSGTFSRESSYGELNGTFDLIRSN